MPVQKITPFLWYAKEAEEAANFYASIFPNSRVTRVTALPSESPSGPPGSVKVVDFELFGQPFTAMSAGPLDEFHHAISLVVTCEDQAEIDRYWDGLLAGGGPHMGDMPNQYVPEDGVLRAQVFNGMVSLDGEDNGIRGRALMLHADGDDYVSQPAGDAGDRLACAVIE